MKIGIFDSGIGGLNFLKAIRKELPHFDYVYFGDTKNFPYGNKSQKKIYELTKKSLEFLFSKDCKIVILACNTASSLVLRKIQQKWLPENYHDRKVLGILIPIAEEIAIRKEVKKVGVIGTKATILSRAYERELLKINNNLKIRGKISSKLVDMVESKAKPKEIINEIKKEISVFNNKIDALILGCTHYSHIKSYFQNVLPNVYILDMEKIVAEKFKNYLEKHSEIKKYLSKNKTEKIFFSNNKQSVTELPNRNKQSVTELPNIRKLGYRIFGYRNKKITLMGLGLIGRGLATAKFLSKKGAILTITDLKSKQELSKSLGKLKEFENIKYVLGEHRKEDFIDADMILQNPAVLPSSPYLQTARKHNIPIETDITLFFKSIPKSVIIIGVTGSKGKSTTTALIYEVLKNKLKNSILLGGNLVLDKSPFDILNKVKKDSTIVLELSSWDLRNLGEYKISPNIGVVTNIIPDHLNKYKSIKEYEDDKKNIFRYQGKDDVLFLNKNDKKVKKWNIEAKSKIEFFNGTSKDVVCKIGKIFGVNKQDILNAISKFKNLEHRQEFVKTIRGIEFYNDSAATIPEATIKAISDLKPKIGKLILILGGVDKNLEYKELTDKIVKNNAKIILLPGTASDKLKICFKNMKYIFTEVKSLKSAVNKAIKESKYGDRVVFSPGAASFNLFKNEFDRGNKFKKMVRSL